MNSFTFICPSFSYFSAQVSTLLCAPPAALGAVWSPPRTAARRREPADRCALRYILIRILHPIFIFPYLTSVLVLRPLGVLRQRRLLSRGGDEHLQRHGNLPTGMNSIIWGERILTNSVPSCRHSSVRTVQDAALIQFRMAASPWALAREYDRLNSTNHSSSPVCSAEPE